MLKRKFPSIYKPPPKISPSKNMPLKKGRFLDVPEIIFCLPRERPNAWKGGGGWG